MSAFDLHSRHAGCSPYGNVNTRNAERCARDWCTCRLFRGCGGRLERPELREGLGRTAIQKLGIRPCRARPQPVSACGAMPGIDERQPDENPRPCSSGRVRSGTDLPRVPRVGLHAARRVCVVGRMTLLARAPAHRVRRHGGLQRCPKMTFAAVSGGRLGKPGHLAFGSG